MIRQKSLLALLSALFFISTASAQAPKRYNAAELQLMVDKLDVLGTCLYIAAHPDDENQRVIGYMALERKFNSAYMALTRGDGGQNLIGPEIREGLGLIRANELVMARSVDGSRQFFSHANDFGYSKTADETFEVWDRQKVLEDVVYVIRLLRPDVIITRFPPDERAGHGHHTASAMLAMEAFEMAGDPAKFNHQLKEVDPWAPKRVYWNTVPSWYERNGETFDSTKHISLDIGKFNPVLGKSYNEIAAESRSMHKSQGFGATGSRGTQTEWFVHLSGTEVKRDLFEDINTDWNRIDNTEEIQEQIYTIQDAFDINDPAGIVPKLNELLGMLETVRDAYWRETKRREVNELIYACTGLFFELVADDATATPGEKVKLNVELINRSRMPVTVRGMTIQGLGFPVDADTLLNKELKYNESVNFSVEVQIPHNAPYSRPLWLQGNDKPKGMYETVVPVLGVLPPGSLQAMQGIIRLQINGQDHAFSKPVVYKFNDPVDGETYEPFEIIPPVLTSIKCDVHLFPGTEAQEVNVVVTAGRDNVAGKVSLQVPEGWTSSPAAQDYQLDIEGAEASFTFSLSPPKNDAVAEAIAVASYEGKFYDRSLQWIDYDHIPKQFMLPLASARIVRTALQKKGENVGYLMGAGDAIPESLEQMGYKVTLLSETDLNASSLANYDAVILGVRAFNTVDALKYKNKELMSYVEQGGTLIVQYNTSHRLVTQDIAPYPLQLSRDRITVEESPVQIIAKKHPIMTSPNKIGPKDFEGWVQERGLYFPDEWDKAFEPILSSKDPGEDKDLTGGLLVAKYGKGYYVYTGYSWFRELPAGVPGAYRIFANMISLGQED